MWNLSSISFPSPLLPRRIEGIEKLKQNCGHNKICNKKNEKNEKKFVNQHKRRLSVGVNGAAEGADDRRETAETTAVRAGREANAGRGRVSAVRGREKGVRGHQARKWVS